MEKIKKSVALILVISLMFSLSACGNGGASGVSQTEYDRLVKENERLKDELGGNAGSDKNGNDGTNNSSSPNDNPPPNEPETPVNEFEYKYDASVLGVVITKYIGSSLKVRIPEKIENESVVEVGDNAFKDSGIMSVYIPNSVKRIGASAFSDCKGLTGITIPENVTNIGAGAFSGCVNLTNVTINGGVRVGTLTFLCGIFWRVLDIQDGKALILSEDILFKQAYHSEFVDITWETCDLRGYLNGSFYDSSFSAEEKNRIAETLIINNDNPQHGTSGGNNTTDKILLLSIEEVQQYFANNSARIARDVSGTASWWWLRSPGYGSDSAVYVNGDGGVDADGYYVSYEGGGVRPALWLYLQS